MTSVNILHVFNYEVCPANRKEIIFIVTISWQEDILTSHRCCCHFWNVADHSHCYHATVWFCGSSLVLPTELYIVPLNMVYMSHVWHTTSKTTYLYSRLRRRNSHINGNTRPTGSSSTLTWPLMKLITTTSRQPWRSDKLNKQRLHLFRLPNNKC